MTNPQRGGSRPQAAPGPGAGPHPANKSAATEDAPAKPLSPALDKTFKIGLVLKGLDGVLEVVGGILLLFLSPAAIEHLVRVLTAHELSEDPHDVVARYLLHTTAHLNHGTTLFGAVYLLSHGIAKVVLVVLVLRDKLWAYPWLIGLLLAFIAYQLYQITVVHFSVGLTALTVFDALLVWLTWREYRAKRARQREAGPARRRLALPNPCTDHLRCSPVVPPCCAAEVCPRLVTRGSQDDHRLCALPGRPQARPGRGAAGGSGGPLWPGRLRVARVVRTQR